MVASRIERRKKKELREDAGNEEWIQRRAEIIDISIPIFAQRGFSNVSMRDIADATGIHMSTIYYYFPNKLDLYRNVVEESLRRGGERTLEGLSAAQGGREKLAAWSKVMIDFWIHDPAAKLIDRELIEHEQGDAMVPRSVFDALTSRRSLIQLTGETQASLLSDISSPLRLIELIHCMIYGAVKQRDWDAMYEPDRTDLDQASLERDIGAVITKLLAPD